MQRAIFMPSAGHEPWLARKRVTEHPGGVFFVEGPASNWIIVRDSNEFTLIDSGYPTDTPRVLESIRHIGLEPERASALLLTHGHVDHTGAAAWFAAEYGTPILCSTGELAHVRGQEKHQVTLGQVLARAWRPRVARWMVHALRAGSMKATPAETAEAWDADLLAQLPGGPVAMVSNAHTPGHASYHLPEAGAIATGDLLVTGHPLSKVSGPQFLHPMFDAEPLQVKSALGALRGTAASLILPGHGPALHGDLRTIISALT